MKIDIKMMIEAVRLVRNGQPLAGLANVAQYLWYPKGHLRIGSAGIIKCSLQVENPR
jgi:hypothetical protein